MDQIMENQEDSYLLLYQLHCILKNLRRRSAAAILSPFTDDFCENSLLFQIPNSLNALFLFCWGCCLR